MAPRLLPIALASAIAISAQTSTQSNLQFVASAVAPPLQSFQKTFGGTGDYQARYVLEISGGYLVAGSMDSGNGTTDGLLMKLDLAGNLVWQFGYGGAKNEAFNIVQPANGGGFIALGETESYNANTRDVFIVKIDPTGMGVWTKIMGGPGFDTGRSLLTVPGGYLVAGVQNSTGINNQSTFLARLDNAGKTLWSQQLESAVSNGLNAEYISGDTLFCSGSGDLGGCFSKISLTTGEIFSTKLYDGGSTEALYYLRPLADGNLLLSDHTWSSTGGTEIRVWAMKIDRSGQPIWSKTYGLPGTNLRGRVEPTPDGGAIISPNDHFAPAQSDAFLIKIDPNGNTQWAHGFGQPGANNFFKCQATADGGFIAVGTSRQPGKPSRVLVVKTDANGHVEACCNHAVNIPAENFAPTKDPLDLTAYPYFETESKTLAIKTITVDAHATCADPQPIVDIALALCPAEVATWNGQQYTAPASIHDTLTAPGGCDTIINIELTLAPQPTRVQTIQFCPGQSITFQGQTYSQPTTLQTTIPATTGSGCDTLQIVSLEFYPQLTVNQTIKFCPGQTVMVAGQAYSQPGTVKLTLPGSGGGCDTLKLVHLEFAPLPTASRTLKFCPGQSVTLGGQVYSQPGTVNLTLPGAGGACDTAATFSLKFLPQTTVNQTISFCPGQSVMLGGQAYSQPGTVNLTLPGNGGVCDTLQIVHLEFAPLPTVNRTVKFCPGQSVLLGGQVFSQPGTVNLTLPGAGGACDTAATFKLEFFPQTVVNQTIKICPGQSIMLGGQAYFQPGTVTVTLPGNGGACDTLQVFKIEYRLLPTLSRSLKFCPGQSVTLGGQVYTLPGSVQLMLPGAGGTCDTLATYTLELLPQPTVNQTIKFCPGRSVSLGGQTFSQPGTVNLTLPAQVGCDTAATFHLEFLSQPTADRTVKFCPGQSVSLGGQTFSQPGTAHLTLPGAGGACDTAATFHLEFLPQPTVNQEIEFCRGDTVSLFGKTYTQPGTLNLTLPAQVGCDTAATFTLAFLEPDTATSLTLICPPDLTVTTAAPGVKQAAVTYPDPKAVSDCPCPGIFVEQIAGQPSGGNFPVGTHQICFRATDSCGVVATCCFFVKINEAPTGCDVKTLGCLRWELLTVTINSAKQKTYRVRVTNACASAATYAYFQVPSGVTAVKPADGTTFTAASGRQFVVRNPNFSPFYSVRFKALGAGLKAGESDVFSFSLPPFSSPDYILCGTRLADGSYSEAHLNTFFCPVTPETSPGSKVSGVVETSETRSNLLVFPNPNAGAFSVDLSDWAGQTLGLRLFSAAGQMVWENAVAVAPEVLPVTVPGLADGVYFLEMRTAEGALRVGRVVLAGKRE